MQNAIFIVKIPVRRDKKKIVIDISDVEVIQVYNITNILLSYNWHLNPINNQAAINLKLQNVKNY